MAARPNDMARRVFFSFHYSDVVRAMNVRNSWVVRGENEPVGFVDGADFETIERQGDAAIKRWIDGQLNGTSVTIVLIGAETWGRSYVQYEIRQSYVRGNGLLGISIHNIQDFNRQTAVAGANPFSYTRVPGRTLLGQEMSLPYRVPVFDWVNDSGRDNIGRWIEQVAPKQIGS